MLGGIECMGEFVWEMIGEDGVGDVLMRFVLLRGE